MPKSNQGVVGDRAKRNYDFLYELFQEKSPKARWSLVENASQDQLGAIVDVCSNISKGHFALTQSQRSRLLKHASTLRKLGNVHSEHAARKHIQKGEGISFHKSSRYANPQIKVNPQVGGLLPAALAPILVELSAELLERMIPDPSPDYMKD